MIHAPKVRQRALPLLAMLLAFASANALDPSRLMTQYVRQRWNTDRGLPSGHVIAIAQTADGYLWIGTDNGLVRFDGFSFQAFSFFSVGLPPNSPVLGLVTDAEGSLVVRLAGAVVLLKSTGQYEKLGSELGMTASHVTTIWKDANGGVFFSDLESGIVRLQDKKAEVLARPSRLPGAPLVTSLAETSDGKLWFGTLGGGLFYVRQGQVDRMTAGLSQGKINCLLSVNNELWVGTDVGLFHWNGRTLNRNVLPTRFDGIEVLTMLRDRESNIWIGTSQGLLRINAKGMSFSDETSLGTNGAVNALFEDREGNLWVGGTNGLERIRDSTFVTYSKATGLPSEHNGPIYADAENRIWSASMTGGLYWLGKGLETVREAGLAKDEIYSIAGQNGEIWVGRQQGGLTNLHCCGTAISSHSYTERNGLAQNSVYTVYESSDGAVWAGTLSGGVSRLKDGRFTTYTAASGLASNTINSILETRDKTMWFATSNGLTSLLKGQWKTIATADGLPSATVNCLFEDSSAILWAGTSEGLAFLGTGHFQVPDNAPELLHEQIFGIAEDNNGWFWIATANHVLAVRRDKLITGKVGGSDLREYGSEDGLLSNEGVKRSNSVISDSSGKIWLSLSRGLSVTDASRLASDSAPAITHLLGISADGSPLKSRDLVRVPASRKRITFAYTGLSLAAPERVRFRYFLEGFDPAWSEPVANREAVYTNLNAGRYRFHLVACNSDGVWNSTETTLQFEIEPVFWKTWWFGMLSLIVFLALLWTFYQLRLRQLQRQFNIGLEARVNERMRIARELHDTLLQSFHGLLLRFQAASNLLPNRPDDAKKRLDTAIDQASQAITEGRDAVQDLRSSTLARNELGEALRVLAEELVPRRTDLQSPHIDVTVEVEGESRPLRTIIRDEVYRISAEALRNAFRHAQAKRIECEIRYTDDEFRVRIRDDGKGIDSETVGTGTGHFGLAGMQERSKVIGAKLELWSRPNSGTEVQLMLLHSAAYEAPTAKSRLWFFRTGKSKSS